MQYQNRPFFRKKQITSPKHTVNFFKNSASYTSAQNSKLTPHKFKSTAMKPMFSTPTIKLQGHWFLKKTLFDPHGHMTLFLIENYLGSQVRNYSLAGFSWGNLLRTVQVLNHTITHHFSNTISMNKPLPVSSLALANTILFTLVWRVGFLTDEGFLIVKGFQPLKTSDFCLGIPTKKITHHTGITSRVRGIAKNPVDHPNGGRANTKGSFKTPWGSYAKNNK